MGGHAGMGHQGLIQDEIKEFLSLPEMEEGGFRQCGPASSEKGSKFLNMGIAGRCVLWSDVRSVSK